MFSAVILTLNEERNLPGCLASLAGCDDLVVLDSGSTDATAQLAKAAGARVFINRFENFAQQRNFAQTEIPFRHPWVFHLDADETMTPALATECATRVASAEADQLDGYFAAPRMMFRGRWIPHCTDFPAWQARYVHRGRFRFVQAGHGQREAPGLRLGHLAANYYHNLSSESETAMAAKLARYARAEAADFIRDRRPIGALLRAWRGGDALARRRALKEMSCHLPARSVLRFVYQYLWRGGWRDGGPGFAYCRMLANYERATTAEIRRLRRAA